MFVQWSPTGGQKQIKILKIISKSGRLREVVAYERWSLTRGGRLREVPFNLKTFCILEKWSLMRGGRLREVVAKGGSTVQQTKTKLIGLVVVITLIQHKRTQQRKPGGGGTLIWAIQVCAAPKGMVFSRFGHK